MAKISLSDVLELSVSERIQLVEDIWDSIAKGPEPAPLTEAQRQELDRRLEAHRENPNKRRELQMLALSVERWTLDVGRWTFLKPRPSLQDAAFDVRRSKSGSTSQAGGSDL